ALDLRHVGAEVGRAEWAPELANDFAALAGEGPHETAADLVAEGVVGADRHDVAIALLVGPLTEGVVDLAAAPAGDPNDVVVALALGQIIGGDDRQEERDAGRLDVVGDGVALVGEERTHEHIDAALL